MGRFSKRYEMLKPLTGAAAAAVRTIFGLVPGLGQVCGLGLVLLAVSATPVWAQDANSAEGFWSFLEGTMPAWAVVGLVILRQLAEIIAKAIPDDAEGALGLIRKVLKVLALYIPNRR